MTQDSKNCLTDSGENSGTQTPPQSLSKEERRKESQRKWREKNKDYWQKWRANHPGYGTKRAKAVADGSWPHRDRLASIEASEAPQGAVSAPQE